MPFKNEKILETKQCTHCSSTFEITDKDLEFYNKISPIFNDEKYSIPTPKLCPDCRQQRRLSFSNARKLYKRKCDATGKDIISIYSTNKKYSVYNNSFWWSDNWSIEDYILDFDSNKKVSDQFLELFNMVPKRALIK